MNNINQIERNHAKTDPLHEEIARHYGYLVADLILGRPFDVSGLRSKGVASGALCMAQDALARKKSA